MSRYIIGILGRGRGIGIGIGESGINRILSYISYTAVTVVRV